MGKCFSKQIAAEGDGEVPPPSTPAPTTPPSAHERARKPPGPPPRSDAASEKDGASGETAPVPSPPRSTADADAARRKARDGAKRIAVAANALARGADVKVQAYPKSEPVMALLATAVSSSPLFEALSSPERATLLHSMTPVTASAGQVIIRRGDHGDKFYVLEKGSAVATTGGETGGEGCGGGEQEKRGGENAEGERGREGGADVAKSYGPGSSFGELALLYSSPRAANVTATSPSKLWVLDAAVYASVRRAAEAASRRRREALVRAVPLLSPLSDSARSVVADALERAEFSDGSTVFEQGQEGDALYLVDDGSVKMIFSREEASGNGGTGRGGETAAVASVSAGGHFGERALVRSEPRAATAVADGYAVLYRLPAAAFASLLGPLDAVWSAEALRRAPALSALSSEQLSSVAAAMKRTDVEAGRVVFSAGDEGDAFYVIEEGEAVVSVSAAARDGEGERVGGRGEGGEREAPTSTREVARLGRGAVFGELALLSRAPRAATVTAATDLSLLKLGAKDFEEMLGSLSTLRTIWRAEALRRVALLAPLSDREREILAAALRPLVVEAGADVVVAGEPGDEFFLVESGELDVLSPLRDNDPSDRRAADPSDPPPPSQPSPEAPATPSVPWAPSLFFSDGEGRREEEEPFRGHRVVGRVSAGGYFGELSLLRGEPRAATVRASTRCELLALPRADFESLLGPAKHLLAAGASSSYGRPGASSPGAAAVPRLEELRRVDVLGSGAFGRVLLVTTASASAGAVLAAASASAKSGKNNDKSKNDDKNNDKSKNDDKNKNDDKSKNDGDKENSRPTPPLPFYALKTLSKASLVEAGLVEHVRREKSTMEECRGSDFVVGLVAAYREPTRLHLLQEVVVGGELFGLLADRAEAGLGPLSEPEARFYAGCVVLGIEHLHSRDLAWRDLKPENLLVASDGYLKLADLGFARRLPRGERATTLCGTPEYLAPELVSQSGHTRSVDWWALGVLVYEMVCGRTPFGGGGGVGGAGAGSSGAGSSGASGDRMAMFRDICKGRYAAPSHLSRELRDLLRRLLAVSPSSRLGSGKGGALEVKGHPWFVGGAAAVVPSSPSASPSSAPPRSHVPFDWEALAAKKIPAPYLPPSPAPRWTSSVLERGGLLLGVDEGSKGDDDEGDGGDGADEGGGGEGGVCPRERYQSTGAFQDF